jgi:hypothetical protein
VQTLQLRFAHRVEVDTRRLNDRSRTLQPTQKNLGGTGIGDCALSQATFDICIGRRRTVTTCCPAPPESRSAGVPRARGCPPPGGSVRHASDRPSANKAGARSEIPVFMRDRESRGERKVSRGGTPRGQGRRSRYARTY